MTTDDKRCVIDTNLLIYATVSGNPWHNEARSWLTKLQQDNMTLCITTQIVREYLVILTRGQIFSQTFTIDTVMFTNNTSRLATYNGRDFKRFQGITLEEHPPPHEAHYG